MKTITVTFHHTTNYGAVLQTYALQQSIMSLGHDNVVLETKTYPSTKKSQKGIYATARRLYFSLLYHLRKKEYRKLQEHFRQFHQNRLHLTRAYTSMEELATDISRREDAMITGSDQVWNMKTVPRLLDSRFLKFGKEDAIRFSYAASIEELDYSEEQKKYVAEALKSFKGVSLREESARKYIEDITNKECRRVLDPVFLLSQQQWNSIATEPRYKGKYILCYQVQRNKRIEEVAYSLKRKYGYPVISICNSPIRWMRSDYSYYDVPIEEFLGFYRNAAFVVSASFHGVAMGLVFEKPVFAMIKGARSNRIKELMNLFQLDKYVIDERFGSSIPEYSTNDMEKAWCLKNKYIISSEGYLIDMLNNGQVNS